MTDVVSLTQLAQELLASAREAHSGRAARTLHGKSDGALRQTMIALAAGHALGEHESPGEATLQVLAGRVRLGAGDESWEAPAGSYLIIPPMRHDLTALEDSVVQLTVLTTTA